MVFPVVMYRCESWTIKKAERRRIDIFELQCWRRLLRVPWTARRSNQSILKEISPECSLEGLMLKFQYFGHLMRRSWLIWKDSDAGKGWRQEEMGTTEDEMVGWHHWLNGLFWVTSRIWWWTGRPGMLQSMEYKESDVTERLNWTEGGAQVYLNYNLNV